MFDDDTLALEVLDLAAVRKEIENEALAECINEAIETMDDSDVHYLYNAYGEAVCDGYNIYTADEFDDVMSAFSPEEVADMVFYGNYKPSFEYFAIDDLGRLQTGDHISDIIDEDMLSDIANFCAQKRVSLDNGEIANIIDEFEEEEEGAF